MKRMEKFLSSSLADEDSRRGVRRREALRGTNPIESLNGSVRRYTRNVKRWRGGSMIQRWVGAGIE